VKLNGKIKIANSENKVHLKGYKLNRACKMKRLFMETFILQARLLFIEASILFQLT